MKEIPFLDDKFKSLEDIIREGQYAETLRSNPAFLAAVRQLYTQYVEAEDGVTAENSSDAGKHRYHYSMLRLVLTDLVRQLDGMIQAGENAKYTRETNPQE